MESITKSEKEIREDVLLDLLFKLRLDAQIYEHDVDTALRSYIGNRNGDVRNELIHRYSTLMGIRQAIKKIALMLLEDY